VHLPAGQSPCHTSQQAIDWIFCLIGQDLNPIELLWAILKPTLAALNPHTISKTPGFNGSVDSTMTTHSRPSMQIGQTIQPGIPVEEEPILTNPEFGRAP
jgi:hypothetical protein